MTNNDSPKDGDYASYLQQRETQMANTAPAVPAAEKPRQTINDVVERGEAPTEEFLEEFDALHDAPPLSDEELERQAMNDEGADGDARTAE